MSNQSPKSEADALAMSGQQLLSASASVFQPMAGILAGARMGSAFAQFIIVALLVFARAVMTPCELLMRHRFGERYFSMSIVFFSILISVALMGGGSGPFTLGVCMLIVTVAGTIFNRVRCFLRDRKGKYWHSYSDGDSFIRFYKGEEWLARYFFSIDLSKQIIEPLILLLIAGFFFLTHEKDYYYTLPEYFWGYIWGIYFLVTAVASFFYHYHAALLRRAVALDKKDAQIMLMVENAASKADPEKPRKLHRVAGVAFIPAAAPKQEE